GTSPCSGPAARAEATTRAARGSRSASRMTAARAPAWSRRSRSRRQDTHRLVRIVIDVSPLSRPRTGIGNYVRGMVAGLAEAAVDEHEVVAFAPVGFRGLRRVRRALDRTDATLHATLLPYAHAWRTAWSRLAWPPVEAVVGPL